MMTMNFDPSGVLKVCHSRVAVLVLASRSRDGIAVNRVLAGVCPTEPDSQERQSSKPGSTARWKPFSFPRVQFSRIRIHDGHSEPAEP
jgi:hypothetical protein